MKTMQTMQGLQTMQIKQESKSRACAAAWHQGSRADYREPSKGFSQRDVSEPSKGKGAF